MSNNRNDNVERKENVILGVLVGVFILATVLKPWLLVWELGIPLMVVAMWACMKLSQWVRSFVFSVASAK
jgi:hypothetical protein